MTQKKNNNAFVKSTDIFTVWGGAVGRTSAVPICLSSVSKLHR